MVRDYTSSVPIFKRLCVGVFTTSDAYRMVRTGHRRIRWIGAMAQHAPMPLLRQSQPKRW